MFMLLSQNHYSHILVSLMLWENCYTNQKTKKLRKGVFCRKGSLLKGQSFGIEKENYRHGHPKCKTCSNLNKLIFLSV